MRSYAYIHTQDLHRILGTGKRASNVGLGFRVQLRLTYTVCLKSVSSGSKMVSGSESSSSSSCTGSSGMCSCGAVGIGSVDADAGVLCVGLC